MMLRTRSLLLLALGALTASAGPAAAQEISSPYRHVEERQSVSVFGRYLFTDAGQLDLGPASGPLAGVRYSIRLGGPFVAEGSATYLQSTRAVFDTVAVGEPLALVGAADLGVAAVDAAIRFNLTGPRTYHNLMPYLVAGGGVAFEVAGDHSIEDAAEIAPDARYSFGTRFAGQIGAGVEWFVARRLSVRADARDVFWKLGTPPAIQRQFGDVPQDEWVQNFTLSLGMAYHF